MFQNPVSDDVFAAFSVMKDTASHAAVIPTLLHQAAEINRAMKAAVSLPRNFPRPGLVHNINQEGIPTCLRTSVHYMPR